MTKPKSVTIHVIPLEGEPTKHTVELKNGMTVGEALASAGISPDRKDLSVTAQPGDKVQPGSTIVANERLRSGQELTVRERPQGS